MRRRNFALLAASGVLAAADAAANPVAVQSRGGKFGGGVYFVNGNAHHTAAGTPFDENGVTANPWWDITSVGESVVTFLDDGSGECTGRTVCKITSVHDNAQKQDMGSLVAVEVADWLYDFSYSLTDGNKLSIVVKPGSWKGRVIGGPRKGKQYDVSVHPENPRTPFVEGYFSTDFSAVELISRDPVSVTVTHRDGGPVEYGRKLFSLYGILIPGR